MKRVLAIASISLRAAVRSKVVLCLLALLAVSIVMLPLTAKGDGTAAGQARVLLIYTLGLVGLILSISTLWAGCAAIAQEVDGRQIHLVVTKPVTRFEIWLGKWLGLLALNGLLLGLSGLTVYGLLKWTLRAEVVSDEDRVVLHEEVLVARRVVMPHLIDVSEEARALVNQRIEQGTMPPGLSEENALEAARMALLMRAYSAPSGYALNWTFTVPRHLRHSDSLHVQYRFSSSDILAQKVTARWRASAPDSETMFETVGEFAPEKTHSFPISPDAIGADGTVEIGFQNESPSQVTVLFSPDDGISLLVNESSFGANYIRALLIMFIHLGFLGALGVTAGSLLSLPVAAFVAVFVMVLLKSSPFIQGMASRDFLVTFNDPEATRSIVDVFLGAIFKVMEFLVAPLESPAALEALGAGQMVLWQWVGSMFLVKIVVYGMGMALIGSWLFNRRELGLPS